MRTGSIALFCSVFFFIGVAQSVAQHAAVIPVVPDSAFNREATLDEVVITATRTENKVSNVPLPIQVISAAAIRQTGSQRLIDILQMQSGLMVASNPLGTALQGYPNPFGDGVQMQGLDPAYTLILIDGEPVTGRNAGIINLDRIAVGNIRQIEILKGPATSLYGSDALAGVINIITNLPEKSDYGFQSHYATNNTLGLTASANLKAKKAGWQFFGKRYSSDGYDFDKNIYGQTVDPFTNYSFSAKLHYDFNEKSNLLASVRYASEKQKNAYLIYPDNNAVAVGGNTVEEDKSIFLRFKNRVHDLIAYSVQLYVTNYANNANVFIKQGGDLFDHIGLSQSLIKPEIQLNIGRNPNSLWVAGIGYNWEKIHSTRYDREHRLNSWYLFGQKQWVFGQTNLIAGIRYDNNMLYPAQLSPKLALAHKFTPELIIKASIGTGFKAPDFRQQFLNFDNTMVNYNIVGAKELRNVLSAQIQKGLLDDGEEIRKFMTAVDLKPEHSVGINVGLDYTFKVNTVFKINLFRNDISNMIESYSLPFYNKNGLGFFSYKNINKVFTEGAEIMINHRINKHFSVNASYQYLIAKDKDVIRELKNGEIYKRDPVTHVSTKVRLSEYKGLFNRSRNSGNVSVRYYHEKWKGSGAVFVKYRGRFGYNGLDGFTDGNDILNDEKEFIKGFTLLNASITKQIGEHVEAQGGIENILNYTNKVYMPNIFGRIYFLNINVKF